VATFVLIHGSGDVRWYWHLVAGELRARGHEVVAPDLPCEDDSAGPEEYADAVVRAIGDRTELIVVAQSAGGLTAPLVCDRVAVELLVLVAPIIPAPGEAPADYWANTGYEGDGDYDDEIALYYQDVPADLAAEARRRGRPQSEARMGEPWPLRAWPGVPTQVLICRDDRLFPPAYLRRVARERLGITPDEIDGGHTPALSRPRELAGRLAAYAAERGGYNAELRRHTEALRRAAGVQPGDRVVDIGCGAGQTTRQAARASRTGSVLGIDVNATALDQAREIARSEGLGNVTFVHGDAQVHRIPQCDLAISRFGTMFFADPPAAFANIASALRPGGRLAMLTWQAAERNEWTTALRQTLGGSGGPAAFSLADPPAVTGMLETAGFTDIAFADVHEPMYFGADVPAALAWIRGFACTGEILDGREPAEAERIVDRLREMLAAHLTDGGVRFDSRAWLVTARRR
jgi:SAM-dependent methyltransferase